MSGANPMFANTISHQYDVVWLTHTLIVMHTGDALSKMVILYNGRIHSEHTRVSRREFALRYNYSAEAARRSYVWETGQVLVIGWMHQSINRSINQLQMDGWIDRLMDGSIN